MIAINEIHYVSKWGENFRKQFADLDMLQSFASCMVPFLGVMVTAPPLVLKQICSHLLFYKESMLIINIGNDQPNLTMVMCLMQGAAHDFRVLDFVLNQALTGESLKWTVIFFNS